MPTCLAEADAHPVGAFRDDVHDRSIDRHRQQTDRVDDAGNGVTSSVAPLAPGAGMAVAEQEAAP